MDPFNLNYENQFMPCECCRFKYSTSSATTSNGFKWTEKEIRERIFELSEKMAKSKWYNRGETLRRLRHWTEKLARYKELKEEFKS